MIRRPPRSTPSNSSAASDVYKRQIIHSSLSEPKANSEERKPLMSNNCVHYWLTKGACAIGRRRARALLVAEGRVRYMFSQRVAVQYTRVPCKDITFYTNNLAFLFSAVFPLRQWLASLTMQATRGNKVQPTQASKPLTKALRALANALSKCSATKPY